MADYGDEIQGAMDEQQATDDPIGLCANPGGIPFQCGTCKYFKQGVCTNPRPKLNGVQVQPDWCCDWYDHAGMKTIIE